MTLRRQASVAALLFAAVISACTAGRKLADTLPAAARSSHEALPGDAALLVRFSPEGWRDVQSFARMLGADLSRTVTGVSELSAERSDPLQLTGPMVLASVAQLLDADSAKSGFDPARPVFTALWSVDAAGLVEAASLGLPPEPKDRPRGIATTILFPTSNADAWAKHLEQWWAGRPMAAATQAKITSEDDWVRLVVFAPWPQVPGRAQEPAAAAFEAFTSRERPEPLRLTPALVSFLADPADVLVYLPLERARAFSLAQHALSLDFSVRNLPESQAARARLAGAAEALQAWQILDPAVAEVEDWSVRMDAVPGQGIVLRGLSTLTAEGRRLAKLRPPPRTMPALRDRGMLAELSFASDGEAARKATMPLRGMQKEGPEGEEVDTERKVRSLSTLMTLLRSPNALLRTVFEGVEGLEGTGSLTALHLRVYPPLGTGDSAAIPRAVALLSFEDEASADRNAEKIRAFAAGPAQSLLRVERPKTEKDAQPLVTVGVLAVPDELRAEPEAQVEVPPGVHLKITAAALDALGARRSEKWEPLAALLRQGPFELRTIAEDTVNRFTLQLGAVPEAKPTKTPQFDPVQHAAEGRDCRLALAQQAEAPLKALATSEPAARTRQLDALSASVDQFQTRCADAPKTQARAAAARERLGRLREHLSTIKEEPPAPPRQDVLLYPPPDAPRPESPLLKAEFPKHAPVKGAADAKVTVLIFSDFQCPFCARVEGTLAQLEKQYGDDLRFVWINQPLAFHKDAKPAAKAALAAHEQGKFWEYKDLLFADIRNLSDDALVERARTLGLDLERFERDRASPEIAERVEQDIALANRLGATGTPTFIINGRRMSGARPIASFTTLIDQELARADALLAEGTPRGELYERLIANGAERYTTAPPPPSAPSAARPQEPAYQSFAIPAKATRISGSPQALVTVVEVISYQCPFCARAEPTMKALEAKYGKDLRRVVLHNPLPFHQNAPGAAKAVLFAAERKKGAQMHALLLANQQALAPEDLEGYARKLGLNPGQLRQALESKAFGEEVARQIELAKKVNAMGTPTFFINGRKIVGAQPQATFEKAIDEELARARAALKKGVPRAKLYETLSAGPE